MDVAGVGEVVDVELGGMDETGGRHVVGLDGPGGDWVVPADAVPIPGGEDVGGAAVPRAGEVAVAVQLVGVLPVAAVVGVAEVVAVVFVVAVAVVVAGGVVAGVVGVAVLVAALVLVDVTGGGGGIGGGAVVVPGAAGAAVVIGAAALGSLAGGGAACRVDGGGVDGGRATVTGGGVTGAGTGTGTICGIQVTDHADGGFTGAVRAGVPDELRGVSDTHGTPDDDPVVETCWPRISVEKSATPGAPTAGPVQYRYNRSSTSVRVNGTIWMGVPTQDASRMYGRPPNVPR